ncbi:DUF2922 domain-containing protein [uncultured Clostridium sp.]|uniref:DUF2922 domain-containing protein n=1 Tax=uncultured Clostridium sp. TaxID=59620 RepID=UPI0025E7A7EC|nr:DUF2922 domain-containing protein [uncultured Clostridium sp.]
MKSLVMKFITETGSKVSITIPKVKDDLDDTKVKAFMELVKEKGVFTFKGGDIISLDSAQIVETKTFKIEL